jgi:hypothetical protein
MAPANNPIDPSPSPSTLTAIHRRRKQLIAFQAWQQSSQATAPLAEEEPQLEEDSSLAPNLTRSQIRGLFHRHLSRERIDLALEPLSSLGLIDLHTEPGRGRHSTLWTGVDAQAINTEPDAGLIALIALLAHFYLGSTRTVRAPSSAARSAADEPAGPPPMTTIFITSPLTQSTSFDSIQPVRVQGIHEFRRGSHGPADKLS